MGIETLEQTNYPRRVGRATFTKIIDVACGVHFNLVLDQRGNDTHVYLIGLIPGLDKTNTNLHKSPHEMMSLRGKQVQKIYAGGGYAAVITASKKVYAWGKLGEIFSLEPVQILEYESIIEISIGIRHAFAITGTLKKTCLIL